MLKMSSRSVQPKHSPRVASVVVVAVVTLAVVTWRVGLAAMGALVADSAAKADLAAVPLAD